MQGADDLMDQLPAITRDAYDVEFEVLVGTLGRLVEIQVLQLITMVFTHLTLVSLLLKLPLRR